jgi:acetylornithine/succinyldiaminopimelate/putrescine aminotransferase
VHGEGLLLAVELESFETVQQTIQQMLAKGLFSDWFLFAPNCLRIAPPLTISMEEIHWACDQILDVLSEL